MKVTLITDKVTCDVLERDTPKHYQGYSNSATWDASLLVFQERENSDRFSELCREIADLETLVLAVANLIKKALFPVGKIKLDVWVTGSINVREIVQERLDELEISLPVMPKKKTGMEPNHRWAFEDPCDLVRFMWDDSTGNAVAIAYVGGIIEALLWAKKLTPDQAESLNNYLTS